MLLFAIPEAKPGYFITEGPDQRLRPLAYGTKKGAGAPVSENTMIEEGYSLVMSAILASKFNSS